MKKGETYKQLAYNAKTELLLWNQRAKDFNFTESDGHIKIKVALVDGQASDKDDILKCYIKGVYPARSVKIIGVDFALKVFKFNHDNGSL